MVLGSNGANAWVENTKVLNNTFYRNNTRAATLLPQKDWAGQVIIQGGVAVPETFTDGGEIVTQRLSNSNDAPGAKIVVQNNIVKSRKGITLSILQPFKTDSFSSASLTKTNISNLLSWDYNLYYIEPGYNNSVNYDFAAAGFTGNTYNFANYKNTVGLDSNSVALELATAPSPDTVFTGGTSFPGRFSLRSGSAAYNIGNPSSSNSGSDDFIYHTRILGGRIDAGALELVVSPKPYVRNTSEVLNEMISVFPNPVINEVNILMSQKQDGLAAVQIWDIAGRLIVNKKVAVQKGINTIKISNIRQAGFSSGTYLLKLGSANEAKIVKLIVQ
jgi:hypothetical protein